MDLLGAVALFVQMESQEPEASEDDLAKALVGHGISPDDAWRVVAFVPLAFGRELLSSSQASFQDRYELHYRDSVRVVRGTINTEPAYVAALQYARAHADDEAVTRIAEWSAEVRTARQLLPDGSSIEESDAVFTEPAMTFSIPEPERLPWWRRRSAKP